jgi:hypothetical protein
MRTVSVVVQICELVTPLRYYAQCVLEESDNDQEAANCWKVSIQSRRLAIDLDAYGAPCHPKSPEQLLQPRGNYLRLDGVRNRVQHIFELACLRPQLVQRARVVTCVIAAPSIAEGTLVAQMVASCAAYLRHG